MKNMREKSCNDCKYNTLTGCNLEEIDKLDCRTHGFSNYAEKSCEPTLGMVQNQEVAESWNGAPETDFKNKDNIMPIDAFSFASCKPFNPKPAKPNRLRPNYYVINGTECKDVIGEFTYNIGAAMKYLWRHGRKTEEGMSEKEKAIEDLRKAVQHIEFEIKRLEAND